MSVHIKQSVREQPDTGYRKSLLASFAADPSWWFVVESFVVLVKQRSQKYILCLSIQNLVFVIFERV